MSEFALFACFILILEAFFFYIMSKFPDFCVKISRYVLFYEQSMKVMS